MPVRGRETPYQARMRSRRERVERTRAAAGGFAGAGTAGGISGAYLGSQFGGAVGAGRYARKNPKPVYGSPGYRAEDFAWGRTPGRWRTETGPSVNYPPNMSAKQRARAEKMANLADNASTPGEKAAAEGRLKSMGVSRGGGGPRKVWQEGTEYRRNPLDAVKQAWGKYNKDAGRWVRGNRSAAWKGAKRGGLIGGIGLGVPLGTVAARNKYRAAQRSQRAGARRAGRA